MTEALVNWQAAGGILDSGGEIQGSVTVGGGMGSVVAIPVPGTNGLAISLKPNGYVPPGGSTSTLFIQDVTGRRQLRLDYGFNKNTGKVDFHWNQKGTFNEFGIRDHTPVGRGGASLYAAPVCIGAPAISNMAGGRFWSSASPWMAMKW
jgi:hypothetical protein